MKPKPEPKTYSNLKVRGVIALSPKGTNSTMFTDCCGCAICDYERKCPCCGSLIIGHDAETEHERGLIRWRAATACWKKRS